MKRPEYVAAAVTACREQRDLGFVTDKTAALLRRVFSRTGFTDGYYKAKLGREMFGTRTKDDVVSADEKLFSAIRARYKDELQNVKISGSFTAEIGKAAVLEVSDGEHTVRATSESLCERALKTPLSKEKCHVQLCKTGGTAYCFNELDINIEDGATLPLSALNNLRRTALALLDEKRAVVHNYKINEVDIFKDIQPYGRRSDSLRARVTGTRLGDGFKNCELVFAPLFADLRELERLKSEGFKIGVEVPRGMFGREKQICSQLERVKALGITDALCHNIGALYEAKRLGFALHGGFGLNIVNTYDLLWAEEYGLADVELSFELTFEQINRLGGSIGRGIISYGYLPLMLCRNCPNKSAGIECKSCKNQSKMKDRKGKSFFLKCDGVCTEVLNCVPLYIAREEISNLSTSFNTFRYSVENYVEKVETITDFNRFLMLKDNFTRGLYRRGVE